MLVPLVWNMCCKVKPTRWGDLLQIQAPESYSLLAIKSLAFLSWTQRILPQVSNQQLCHLQTMKINLIIFPERCRTWWRQTTMLCTASKTSTSRDMQLLEIENKHLTLILSGRTIASHPNLTNEPTIVCNYFLGFPVDHTNISVSIITYALSPMSFMSYHLHHIINITLWPAWNQPKYYNYNKWS